MMRRVEVFALPVLLMMMVCRPVLGQAQASTLKVELRNVVEYQDDLSKYGTNTGLTVGSFTTSVGCLGHQVNWEMSWR